MIEQTIWKPFVVFATLLAALVGSIARDQAVAAPASDEIVIVAFGDSLTAGFQLPPTASFPVQLEKALKSVARKGVPVRVRPGAPKRS